MSASTWPNIDKNLLRLNATLSWVMTVLMVPCIFLRVGLHGFRGLALPLSRSSDSSHWRRESQLADWWIFSGRKVAWRHISPWRTPSSTAAHLLPKSTGWSESKEASANAAWQGDSGICWHLDWVGGGGEAGCSLGTLGLASRRLAHQHRHPRLTFTRREGLKCWMSKEQIH